MCDICGRTPCASRCPNYVVKELPYVCADCHEVLLDGDEYIVLDDGIALHTDCSLTGMEMARLLKFNIEN